jgi:hypothetical protein
MPFDYGPMQALYPPLYELSAKRYATWIPLTFKSFVTSFTNQILNLEVERRCLKQNGGNCQISVDLLPGNKTSLLSKSSDPFALRQCQVQVLRSWHSPNTHHSPLIPDTLLQGRPSHAEG